MDKYLDRITDSNSKEELDSIKHQLFMENVRIQSEKSMIETEHDNLHRERKDLLFEKKQLQREKKQLNLELNQLREQAQFERKRLKDDEKLLEKKVKILQKAYELFDKDKENLNNERIKVESEKERLRRAQAANNNVRKEVYATGLFFRGVNNEIALKKRYKDLMKIYHPDNISGDNEILLKINEEYSDLRNRFEKVKKA